MIISELIVLNFCIEHLVEWQLINEYPIFRMNSSDDVVTEPFIRWDSKTQTLKLQDLVLVENLFWVLGVKPLSFSLIVCSSIEQLEHVNFALRLVQHVLHPLLRDAKAVMKEHPQELLHVTFMDADVNISMRPRQMAKLSINGKPTHDPVAEVFMFADLNDFA